MRRSRLHMPKPPGLMLTSLLDMFTIILIFLYEKRMIAPILGVYVLGSLAFFIMNRGKVEEVFDWAADDKD